MKITKSSLKQIIQEEYLRLQISGKLSESYSDFSGQDNETLPAHEDNQTKMVRKYLTLRGEEANLSSMSQEEIEALAANLRSLPPSTKKRWGIYDLREADGATKKYDNDSALKGKQSKLPDALQKSIIDKSVEDRDERDHRRIGKEMFNKSLHLTFFRSAPNCR